MPVTLVGTPVTASSARDKGSTNPISINVPVTVPAGTDLLLVPLQYAVGASGSWASPPTFNGIALSTYVTITGNRLEIFYLLNPPAGTYNLYANYINAYDGGAMLLTASMYDGVDTAAPFSGWTSRGIIGPTPWTSPAIPSVAGSQLMLFSNNGGTQSGWSAPNWTVTAPGYKVAQITRGFSDGSKTNYNHHGLAGQPGTGGNLTFSISSVYNLSGAYYTFNILPRKSGMSKVIWFF